MRSFRCAKLAGNAGQSVVELALALPVLVTLALGVLEMSRLIRANNVIINMSREGASLASRTSRASISAEELMNSLASTAQPLVMTESGTMCITEIRKDANSDTVTALPPVPWSRNSGNCPIDQDSVGRFARVIPLSRGQSIYVFEVGYSYPVLGQPDLKKELKSSAVF